MKKALFATTAIVAVLSIASGVPVHGAAATGTITGHVKLTGPAPANPPIRMGADPLCAKLARESGKRPVQQYVVTDGNGNVANAFVELQGTFASVPAPPKEPVVLTQRGCVYSPRVVGIRVGQPLRIVNSDTLLHNLHGISSKNNGFNATQPQSGMVNDFVMKAGETMLHVTCDVHNWMSAWVGVETHPYFAVSAADGAFTIANAPAGRHTLRAWQERYGWIMKVVDVKPGATVAVDLAYTGKERPPARSQEVTIPEGVLARFIPR